MRRRSTGRDAEAVEAIRALAQIVVWGDQNNPSLWDVFMNGQVMFHLSEILKHTTSPAVRRQCLQSISIMVQSFRNDTSLYNLFSRNHINEILTFKADRDDLELIGHLISLIRGITNRINDDLLQFFFDEDAQSFPLYEKATELFDHKEAMFRIAIRNATLSIFNLEDERVLEYATKDLNSESHYFNRLFFYVRSIEDMVERAFSRCAQADLPDATLHSIDNQMCELESILDYVNEAIANNERTIGAYLGGAAIREFVQPPLIEMASLAGSDRAQLGKFERRAGIFGWHVALCLVLLKHKLIGRAMTAEMLSSFSHNGQTPSQCLKDLVMLSIDERAVHMALCAVEALVSYPLCEYDDLINAGFALASRTSTKSTECCPGDCPDANGTGHSPRSLALDDSGEINLSSSLSGYDFVTGNQLPKSDLDEDSITDDEVNSLGATFIDLVSSVFRMERPTRSLRVVQACARLVLAVAHAGGEVIGRSCAAIAAILLSEYLCAIRSVMEEDPEVAISMHEALLASFKAKALRRPPKLEDQLCQCDIVTNKGFYLPPSPQMAGALKLEGMRRKRLRHGISVQRSSRKLSKLEEVKKRFIRFDADTLCVLAWLTAELAEQHDALAQLEERMKEAVDAPSPLKPMTAKTSVERILDAFAGLCTAKRERGDVPDDDAKKPAHQVTGSGKT
mmetsp:Transcript_36452/g.145704  ORF Transcript_36452/g.145704 Transcript_36452/m.145704 type:complete len:681 (+) Transcript_36452:857-2899(+)